MPKATTKSSKKKRTALKNLSAKVKDVSSTEGKRVKGGKGSGGTLTINGVAFKP